MLLAAQTSDDQDYRQFGVAHDKLRLQLRLRARDAPGRCRQLSVTDVRLQHLARPTSVVEASLRVQQFSYQDDQRKVFVVHDQFTKGDDRLALSMEYDALGRLARECSNTTTKISATGSFTPRVKKHGLHGSLAVRYFFRSEPDPSDGFHESRPFIRVIRRWGCGKCRLSQSSRPIAGKGCFSLPFRPPLHDPVHQMISGSILGSQAGSSVPGKVGDRMVTLKCTDRR